MPQADFRDVGREPAYGYSPSGPRGASMQPWADRLQAMLRNVTYGLDPYRQQPRAIQTTDPGAGYGQSPSGPTARLGSAQFPMSPQQAPRDLQPQVRPRQNVTEQFSVPANYGGSPSNPNWQPRKLMSPFYEPFYGPLGLPYGSP